MFKFAGRLCLSVCCVRVSSVIHSKLSGVSFSFAVFAFVVFTRLLNFLFGFFDVVVCCLQCCFESQDLGK